MNWKNNLKRAGFLLFILPLLFSSCKKKNECELSENYEFNQFIYQALKKEKWYLWYETMPDIPYDEYWSPADYLDALKNPDLDHWSYVTTEAAIDAYYEEGAYTGYGFSRKYDHEGNMRISYVFDQSPMALAGVERGYKLLEINGKNVHYLTNHNLWNDIYGPDEVGVSSTFTLETLEGDTVDITLQKAEVFQNPVLYSNVYPVGSQKVGYMVLNSFIEPTQPAVDEAFAYFASEQVSDVVLDLRYNGGGLLDMAAYTAAHLLSPEHSGQPFATLAHNSEKADNDAVIPIPEVSNTLNLNRLFVITSKSTASASEAIINGLTPYIDVLLIGDDTYGKPVGMYIFKHNGYALVPVCFETVNANNQGGYFSGIEANAYRTDGLQYPFGHQEEDCLEEALFYIENGYFSNEVIARQQAVFKEAPLHGLRAEIGAW